VSAAALRFPSPRARRFARDATGLAAVEFAIILPVALLIMALVVYGGQIYRVQRKVSLAAATVANLVAQAGDTSQARITTAGMAQILAYPELILYPFDPTQTALVVVAQVRVTVASGTSATIVGYWANANAVSGAGTPACGQSVTLDPQIVDALTAAGGAGPYYLILGTVSLPFQPYDLFGSIAPVVLQDSSLSVPRTSNSGIRGPSPNGC
jgi:Flp pilus assembly protein TadG